MALSTAATPVRDNPLMDRRPGRVIDVVLVTLFVVDGLSAGAGASRLPIAELAGALLVLVAAFRRPQRHLPEFGAVALLGGAILIYLGVISAINDVDEADVWRRLIRVALLMTLIGAFASRRIDLRAGLQGLVIALAVNIPLFYSGIAPDTYGGVLTGLLGDKNVAGMYYAAMPVLLMATTRNRRVLWACLALAVVGTFLTGSRTSLAALACAIVWMLVAGRLGAGARILLWASWPRWWPGWQRTLPASASSLTGWAPICCGSASPPRPGRRWQMLRGSGWGSPRPPWTWNGPPGSSITPMRLSWWREDGRWQWWWS